MAAKDPALRNQIAAGAARARWGGAAGTEARQQLKEQALERYIRQTVDSAPPLTPEQRDRLALLLRGTAA